MRILHIRLQDDGIQTLSRVFVFDGTEKVFEFVVLEPSDKNNANYVSCIPRGTYRVSKWNSPSKGACFKFDYVVGRTFILIHVGNYRINTEGCLLPGTDFIDLNFDNRKDVLNSRKTLEKLLEIMPESFDYQII